MMAIPAFSSLPKKNQMLIALGIPGVVVLLMLFWAFKALGTLGKPDPIIDPNTKLLITRDTPESVWATINTTQSSIVAQDLILAESDKVNKQYNDIQSEISSAMEQLPQETEKAEMRAVIERLAREIPKDIGTVELKSVAIQETVDRSDGTHTLTFQTDLTGDQDGIIKYIDSIEKNQRLMFVNNLSIRGGQVTADPVTHKPIAGLHTVHMDIVTFVYTQGQKK